MAVTPVSSGGRRLGSGKRVLTYDEEYGIAVYYTAGIPTSAICAVFDISRSGVNRVVKRLGIEPNRGKRLEVKRADRA